MFFFYFICTFCLIYVSKQQQFEVRMHFKPLVFLFLLGYLGQSLSVLVNLVILTTLCVLSYNWPDIKSSVKQSPSAWETQPDMERAEWLNKIIRTIWSLSLAEIQRTLRSLSELITLEYFSPGVEITLNTRGCHSHQPRLGGVRSHGVKERARLVTDLHLQYESDSLISIDLFTKWTFLQISLTLSRIEIKAHLRLECELKTMQESELLQRIQISALEFPQIDISFGLLSALIGVDKVVNHCLAQFCASYLMFPSKYELYANRSPTEHPVPPSGVLNIFVQEAKGLLNKDRLSFSSDHSDPYVIILFSVDRQQYKFQSQTLHNSLEARWKYMCQVPVEEITTLSSVKFKVMDSDLFTSDDHLGSTEISVHQSELLGNPLETWRKLYLSGKPAGKLKIMMSFSPCRTETEEIGRGGGGGVGGGGGGGGVVGGRRQGVVTVFVDSCQNLSKLSNSHPYWRLKARLGETVQVCRTVQMSSSPVFSHKFVFIVSQLETEELSLSLHNVKNNKLGGLLRLGVSSIARSGLTLSQLVVLDLTTKTPAGQKKDPKIVIRCQYRAVQHCSQLSSLFPTQSSRKILKISEEKLFKNQISILESSTAGTTKKTVLLDLTLYYDPTTSLLRLVVNSISYLTTTENFIFLLVDLKRGKLHKKISEQFTIDTYSQNGKTSTLNLDKTCQFRVERNDIRNSKLKVKTKHNNKENKQKYSTDC